MGFRDIFPSMYPPEDSELPKSRNATLYLLRCVFVMGIRTPPKRFFVVYCLWSFVLNLCSTFYQPIGFMTGYIIHLSTYTPAELLTSLQVAFNAWSCSIKVIIAWIFVKRFDKATEILDQMDQTVTLASERRTIHRFVALSNRIFFFFMSVYISYATSTFLSAVIMGKPPYQNYYPILDWRADKWQFWLQSGLEYFTMLGACFQDVCLDCYPINFVLPLRAHMRIFANRLRQLGNNPEETPEQRYEKLVKCIKDHKVILSFCDVLRPMIGGTIFVQLLVVGLVMGFTLINIVQFANFGSRVASFSFMSAVVLQTTPFCILCNYLTDDCLKLADALFESNWIDQNNCYKRTLTHFLHNLQKPIVFMAGNVFSISVATNLTASKFSFSVFTLVQNMNLAEKLAKLAKPQETDSQIIT